MKLKGLILVVALTGYPGCRWHCAATEPVHIEEMSTETEVDDPEQSELREGEINIEGSSDAALALTSYTFIRQSANAINLNGDDWSELRERFATVSPRGDDVFTFLHIGDSHLQADIGTGEMRALFQAEKGNAGRGVIVPWRMSGSNEPRDYSLKLDCAFNVSKLLKQPWPVPMAFTGVGITPRAKNFVLTVQGDKNGYNTFRMVRLYVSGDLTVNAVKDASGRNVHFAIDYDDDEVYTDVFLDNPTSSVALSICTTEGVTLHGAMLSTETPGIVYHVIGNNGATYYHYNTLPGFGASLSSLYPDLIIVSLGTNEAFGTMPETDFRNYIHGLVTEIKSNNPEAKLLLTTPMECRRRISRRGRKRRRITSYQTVTRCKTLRDVIVDYGRENSIPVYDWYTVAGAEGAAEQWMANALLGSDGVHHTSNGYTLYGRLFHHALNNALSR